MSTIRKGTKSLTDGAFTVDLNDTPKFRKPPVVETVLGVQFKLLPRLQMGHYGLFWERIRSHGFDKLEQHPPLEHIVERVDPEFANLSFSIAFGLQGPVSPARVWFLSADSPDGQQLIQLQQDRLIQNWRALEPAKSRYISFHSNRDTFERTFKTFQDFVKSEELGTIEVDQCEVIYVNQIPIDDDQSAGSMFEKVFRSYSTDSLTLFGKQPGVCSFDRSFWIDRLNGRLHVGAATATVLATKKKTIDFRLIGRGSPKSSEITDVLEWLDVCHYFVVNAFDKLTTEQMHTVWEKEKNDTIMLD